MTWTITMSQWAWALLGAMVLCWLVPKALVAVDDFFLWIRDSERAAENEKKMAEADPAFRAELRKRPAWYGLLGVVLAASILLAGQGYAGSRGGRGTADLLFAVGGIMGAVSALVLALGLLHVLLGSMADRLELAAAKRIGNGSLLFRLGRFVGKHLQ
jgi:hypothetical protein